MEPVKRGRPKKGTPPSAKPGVTKKLRNGFTIKKDIELLKLALSHNPFQLGEEYWDPVVKECNTMFKLSCTARTARHRIDLLIEQFEKQEFKTRTGSEEEKTERGSLIEKIVKIQAEEQMSTIQDADSTSEEMPVFTKKEVNEVLAEAGSTIPVSSAQKQSKASRIAEKRAADLERDLISEDFHLKPGRKRLSFEQTLIKERQAHELLMEEKKIKLEEEKLELERLRESRLAEEIRRKDEHVSSQLQMQHQMNQIDQLN